MTTTISKNRINIAVMVLIILAFCCWPAFAGSAPQIKTDQDEYQYGEKITVHFYHAPGYARDWICIVPAGSPDTEAGDYQYMPNGTKRGKLVFKSPRPGRYEARAYYNYRAGQYIVSARHRFRVK